MHIEDNHAPGVVAERRNTKSVVAKTYVRRAN